MTLEDYILAMETKAPKNEAIVKEHEEWKALAKQKKAQLE